MEEPKSLDDLFKEKIFRIPDHKRSYARQKSHIKDFWEDRINLSHNLSHYTGVLTLKQMSYNGINEIEIKKRGLRVFSFIEKRWNIRFEDIDIGALLFMNNN